MASHSRLVGRERERALIGEALARCQGGTGGVLLVSGEAGVGKSRVMAEVLGDWTGRQHVSAARPGGDPFALLGDLVCPRGQASTGQVVEDLVAAARQGPTVVVLDDLQWADSATIELLPPLAQEIGREPMLVVGIYRSDELPRTHHIRTLRVELRRAHHLVDIPVYPLGRDDTGRLLEALLPGPPSPDLLTAVHERTEGLPFFVEELAAALLEGGGLVDRAGLLTLGSEAGLPLPESVVDAATVRTASLRARHLDAVEYAAILGVQVDIPVLAELAGPAEVDVLLDAGLLVEFDEQLAAFRHALVQESLYRTIPWARRRDRHRSAAQILQAGHAPPMQVAHHWVAAHEPRRARPLLLAAAEQACAVHAYRDAATAGRLALALWPEGEDSDDRLATLERMAECAELSGELAEAVGIWSDVALQRRAGREPAAGARAHRRAANAAELLGDRTNTAAERAEAAAAFAQAGEPGEAAVEHLALAAQLKAAGRLSAALEQTIAATSAADRAGRTDLQGQALAFQGAVRAALGQGSEGIRLARSGLELALTGQLNERVGEILYEYAEAFEYAADYAAAVEAYESAHELCHTHGFADLAQICFVCTAPVLRLMGDWDRSLAICAEVLADEDSATLTRRVAEEESGLVTALRGNPRKARGPLRRAVEFGQATGVFGLEVGARWGLSVVAELEGDEAAGRSAIREMLDCCATSDESHYALPALRWAASYLAQTGDAEGVSGCHRIVAKRATRNSSPKVLSALAHVGGEVSALSGEADQAHSQFGRSLELLDGIRAPLERAHTKLRAGLALTRSGDSEAGSELLMSSYHIARRLAARPLVRATTAALAETGEGVDLRPGRSGTRALAPGGLTRREREVLGHLAEGRTNRETAAALFLSTRTVDMHVRNVLAKLGCSSRTAAVRRAAELSILPADR